MRRAEESIFNESLLTTNLTGTYKRYEDPALCLTNENFWEEEEKPKEEVFAKMGKAAKVVQTPVGKFKPKTTSTEKKVKYRYINSIVLKGSFFKFFWGQFYKLVCAYPQFLHYTPNYSELFLWLGARHAGSVKVTRTCTVPSVTVFLC